MNYKIWAFACAFCVGVGLGGAHQRHAGARTRAVFHQSIEPGDTGLTHLLSQFWGSWQALSVNPDFGKVIVPSNQGRVLRIGLRLGGSR